MKKTIGILACAILMLSGRASVAAQMAELGVYKGAGCTGVSKMGEFVRWYGKAPARALDFFSYESWGKLFKTANWSTGCWKHTHYKMSYSVPMLPKARGATLSAGAKGQYNKYFSELAKLLIERGYSHAVLRIGWEFNGNWYPWTAVNREALWVLYWRQIIDTMRRVPGAHFRFEWSVVLGDNRVKLEDVYPGDEYVDIVGADVYNQGWSLFRKSPAARWKALVTEPYGLDWLARFARFHGKPISIPEWGTGTRPDGHGMGDDPIFVAKMATWIGSHNVLYHDYWDYPARDYNAQLSNGQYPQAGKAFLWSFRH